MATTRNLMIQLKDAVAVAGGRRAVSDRRGAGPKRSSSRKKAERKRNCVDESKKNDDDGEMRVETSEDPRPVGNAIESDDLNMNHYSAFRYDGRRYHLEDFVLVTPVEENAKPDVAIIKGISETVKGSMFITVQWFYRPEQLDSADEESWSSVDNRELLISNHQDEVPAESIMHQCVVHFLPDGKTLPDRKNHPGFVVLYFFDHLKKKAYNITDGEYNGSLQKEIHLRMQETKSRIGLEDTPTNNDEASKR